MELSRKTRRILFYALSAGLALFSLKYLLPFLLPFLLGIGAAMALTPLIRLLQQYFSLRRGSSAALAVTGVLAILAAAFWLLAKLLMHQLLTLFDRLPALIESASQGLSAFGHWAETLSELFPGGVGDAFSDWAQKIVHSGGTLAASLYERLFSLVYGFLGKLPDTLLFLLTTVLSCYFAAAELPRLLAICRAHLSPPLLSHCIRLKASIKTVLTGWLRAQLLLMGITFLILLCGLWLLGYSFPLLPALMIALLDALPLFGHRCRSASVGTAAIHLREYSAGARPDGALCGCRTEPQHSGAKASGRTGGRQSSFDSVRHLRRLSSRRVCRDAAAPHRSHGSL